MSTNKIITEEESLTYKNTATNYELDFTLIKKTTKDCVARSVRIQDKYYNTFTIEYDKIDSFIAALETIKNTMKYNDLT